MKRIVSLLVPSLLVMLSVGALAAEPELRRLERGQPLDPCPQPSKGSIVRESRGEGFTVDSCGRKVDDSGEILPLSPAPTLATATPATIDRMTTQFSWSRSAGDPLMILGYAKTYTLSDGSHWESGAGSGQSYVAQLDHIEMAGTKIRYVMVPPASGQLYQQTDYDSGDHSAQGTLNASGPLVLEAEVGSTKAVLRGNALLFSNNATSYGDLFNYYTAVVGSVVPIEVIYTIQGGGTWTSSTFSQSFSYTVSGLVDFANPVSEPPVVALSIVGPRQVPDETVIRFRAVATYQNGVQRDVSSKAAWTVDPMTFASVAGGVLTLGTLPGPQASLTLGATIVQEEGSLAAGKTVLVLADPVAEAPGTWPMFQANARHTGHLGVAFDPSSLRLKWQRDLGNGKSLNPVAAGDGKVFVTLRTYFDNVTSLFALQGSDGATLWSKGFGSIFSVNPPSYAYGNVYVQTGNHGSDTWLRAFDGETGDVLFKSPHSAQWERYLAPTVYDGKIYINGGYFGGMYGFDAYAGDQLWFTSLPQYDEWTPAVDAGHAYAYVGEYEPGLYALNRATGASSYFVSDPNFDWNGWSMNLAPVLGDHDDLIAIHDGRLLSFDTAAHAIRWEVQSQFTGQPSVAQDRIYAIDNGRLRVLDELTHAELWSWQPNGGGLDGAMIVTDSHVFVSSASSVYAVRLATHQPVWSYPVGGHLAYADGTLYVASMDGKLSAFASPAPTDTSFYTVPPCRLLDTRTNGSALTAGVVRSLHLAGVCGVPATARALVINATVIGAGSSGYLRLGAVNPASPTSTLNYPASLSRSNNVFVELTPSGDLDALAVQSAGTTVHLIVDVSGYFE